MTTTPHSQLFELIIIGAGTAGLAAADEALLQGFKRVALIEREAEAGGDCANFACVPTKTLLTATRIRKTIVEQAPQYGLNIPVPVLDYSALANKVEAVIYDGGYDILSDERITYIQGEARFISANQIAIRQGENEQTIEGKEFIIAAGAQPVVPDIEGFEPGNYMIFRQASRLKQLPASLIVLGAGPVGVEFSQALANLGVQVTLINRERILRGEEPEISEIVTECLKKDGVRVVTKCEAIRYSVNDDGRKTLTVRMLEDQSEKTFTADNLLLATGLEADLEPLALDKAGVRFNKIGIEVDGVMRTSVPHIRAIGDAVGPYRFTHVADYQAVVAVRNMAGKSDVTVDYHALPWAIYTMPTVAHVGMTEAQAKEKKIVVDVVTATPEESSRHRIESKKTGFIKIIIDRQRRVILGGHIVADGADDMAHLLLLAIQENIAVEKVRDLMYIYPTRAQLIQKALEKWSPPEA